MNKYKKYSVNALRKLIGSELQSGNITESGQRPKAPSKVFRMANKKTLCGWLNRGHINWASDYDNDGVIMTQDTKSTPPIDNGNDSKLSKSSYTTAINDMMDNDDSDDDTTPGEPGDDCNTGTPDDIPGQTPPDTDTQYVTTNGVKSAKEVVCDLNIDKNIKSAFNFVNDKISTLQKAIGDGIDTQPATVSIKYNGDVIKKSDDHYHSKFETICNYAKWHNNVMLVGDAGTGKTTVAHQVADAFEVDFAHLSCSAGMSEAHLLGRMLFDGSYVSSDFVRIYENGGVFLFDEFDALDGNCAVVINSALANGSLSVPNRKDKPTATRHKDCYIISACNTWGTGYGTNEYAGRNRLDAATLDRFCASKIHFGYDKALEKKLSNGNVHLFKALQELRKRVKRYRLQRIISTRLFERGAVACANGETLTGFFNTVTIDWADEEKNKVSIDGIISLTAPEVK